MTAPSDLPTLPEGWVWTKLGDIGEIASGGTPSTKVYTNFDGDISWITPADLSGFDEKFIARGRRNLSEKGLNSSSATLLPAGTVLYSSRAPIGYVAIATSNISTNQGFKNIVLGKHIFNEYVYYYLKGSKKLAESFASGTTFSELSAKRFSQLPIPFPPLPEQHRIVAKIEELFTKLDAGVKSLEKTKAQLKRYRQAVLKYAFEGKLTEEWRETHKDELEPASVLLERIKEERKKTLKEKYKELPPQVTLDLPVLPKGGVWTTLGLCSKEIYRYPTFYGISHLKEGIPVIRGEHIRESGSISHDWGNYWYVSEDISNNFKRTILEFEDLIMSVRGSVGKIGFVDDVLSGAQISPNCIRISLFKNYCNPKYILNYLKSITGQGFIKGFVNATTIQTIKASLIIQIPIPLLPLPEQHKIVEEIERRFSVADSVEKVVNQSLKQAERLRQSILKRSFEGKLVPQDPTDEPASVLLERIKEEKAKRKAEQKTKKIKKKIKPKEKDETKSLYDILKSTKKPLTPTELWELSNLIISKFYEELKKEVEEGKIVERKTENNQVFLEVKK